MYVVIVVYLLLKIYLMILTGLILTSPSGFFLLLLAYCNLFMSLEAFLNSAHRWARGEVLSWKPPSKA